MKRLRNEKGVILLSSVFLVTVLAGFSAAFLTRSINELWAVEREEDRLQAYCGAEAGFQASLGQIGSNSYTGFVNTSDYTGSLYLNGSKVSDVAANVTPESSDFITVESTGTTSAPYNIKRSIRARVFLDSNLSKYLVYAETTSFSSGSGAQYGEPMTDPDTGNVVYDENGRARVPIDEYDRAMMYFTGDWNISGSGVEMYGDVYVEDDLNVSSGRSVDVYGDTMVRDQYQNYGSLNVDDTYDDGADKRRMSSGMEDTLQDINLTFYRDHNSVPTFGQEARSRYLEFDVSADGTHTVIREYNDRVYSNEIATHDIPSTGIVYVNGDAYIKGTIKGRVSVVASDDIFIQDSLVYANGEKHADESDAAAFMARDKLYFCGNNMETCGIFYAERVYSDNPAFDSNYNVYGRSDPYSKNYLRIRGNRIIKGNTNLGNYDNRAYIYDPYLKKYRPPGLPITSVVSFVREIPSN